MHKPDFFVAKKYSVHPVSTGLDVALTFSLEHSTAESCKWLGPSFVAFILKWKNKAYNSSELT